MNCATITNASGVRDIEYLIGHTNVPECYTFHVDEPPSRKLHALVFETIIKALYAVPKL
jgi:hypothetical protein